MVKSFSLSFLSGVILLTLCLNSGCKKKNETNVPYEKVDIYIYPSQPLYNNLNNIGGWVYVSGGYKGIIVYRKDQTTFNAYERACTFDPEESCSIIKVSADNLTCVDSCCGSKFLIVEIGRAHV